MNVGAAPRGRPIITGNHRGLPLQFPNRLIVILGKEKEVKKIEILGMG
jgi:hypothetical protein